MDQITHEIEAGGEVIVAKNRVFEHCEHSLSRILLAAQAVDGQRSASGVVVEGRNQASFRDAPELL